MHIDSIAEALEHVETAGTMALDAQRKLAFHDRSYKADGSVLTQVDTQVEEYLFARVSRLYPGANILTEETARSFDPARPYTFTIDPIDGTDVFSQGMAGWCVCLGLLDGDLTPIAGIVFAPKLDLLIFADVGRQATCNGEPIVLPDVVAPLSARSNIMISSTLHRQLDLTRCPGKLRNVGSAALHICYPVIYPGVVGAILHSAIHIWDVVAAHAITLSHGWDLEYLRGDKLDYATMVDGSCAADVILVGPDAIIGEFRTRITRIHQATRPGV
jgi:fructose-1,6-bisphosphatase/inositol monophosphatase family enzyme